MKNKIALLGVLLSVSLIFSGCKSTEKENAEASIARLDNPIEAAAKAEAEAQVHQAGEATYEPYSTERFEQLKGKKPFAVFFHAAWCPICKALEKDILEQLGEMGPTLILKANYDSELELEKEYAVAAQTTILFFNKEGELVQKKLNPSVKFIKDFFNQ